MKRDAILVVAVWTAMTVFIGMVFYGSLSLAMPPEGKAADGKSIFTRQHCTECHSITAVGIKKEAGSTDPAAEEAPDLSGVGTKRTADWITRWLLKKEMIEGKKHEKKFKGTAEELSTVAKWLETMKTSVKAGKK